MVAGVALGVTVLPVSSDPADPALWQLLLGGVWLIHGAALQWLPALRAHASGWSGLAVALSVIWIVTVGLLHGMSVAPASTAVLLAFGSGAVVLNPRLHLGLSAATVTGAGTLMFTTSGPAMAPGPYVVLLLVAAAGGWYWHLQRRQRTEQLHLAAVAFDQSTDARLITDARVGRLLQANPAALEMFGSDNHRRICRHLRAQLDAAGLPLVLDSADWRRELPLTRLDGHRFWGELLVHPIATGGASALLIRIADISRRKRVERALVRQDRLLRTTEDIALVGGWEYSNERLTWTPGLKHIMDAPDDYEPGVDDIDGFFNDPDGRTFNELVEASLAETGSGSFDFVTQAITFSGRIVWLRIAGGTLEDAGGETLRMWGIAQDVTAAWQREAALRDSQQLLNQSQAIARIGSWSIDLATREVTWTRSMYSLFRMPEQPVTETEALAVYHPVDRRALEAAMLQVLHDGAAFQHLCRARATDGSDKWIQVDGGLLVRDGLAVGIHGTAMDVTERELRAAAMRRSEKLLEDTQSIAQVAGWERDLLTGQVTWTRSAWALWRLPESADLTELNGNYELFGPVGAERLQAATNAAIANRGTVDMTLAATDGVGEDRWFRVRASASYQDDTPVRISGTIMDVTGTIETQRTLERAKEAAESAVEARTRFLANMSHEIRTPMNGVIGMTSLLLDSELEDTQRVCLETIRTSGESLLTVINEILDFSKIDADQVELEHIDYQLEQTLFDAVDVVSTAACAKDVELIVQMDPELPATLQGDPTRMRQILVNLLGNAVKFTDAGQVVLRADLSRSRADDDDAPARLQVSVTDTGIGIEPDTLAHLFDPFAQGDSSATRRFGGTGLGLSITRQLIELMGGQISVKSSPGHGSQFSYWVPLADAPKRTAAAPSRRCVLAVEGNPTQRAVLEQVLAQAGVRPALHADPQALLDDLGRRDWDAIIVGIGSRSPFDGEQLAHSIRERAERPVPIIALCDIGHLGSLDAVVDARLVKPVRPSLLIEQLERVSSTRQPKTRAPASAAGPGDSRLRILLAEDNLVNQKVALSMLERLGARADVAANGVEAVRLLAQRPYELILMDIQMPEMDGLEATRRIRQMPITPQPFIAAMTANATSEDRNAALQSGMNHYLSKPVRLEKLAELLQVASAARASAA